MKRPVGFDGYQSEREPTSRSEQVPSVAQHRVRRANARGADLVTAVGPRERQDESLRQARLRLKQTTRQRRRRERQEQRRFTERLRARRRRLALCGIAGIALVVFVAVGAFTPVMAVRTIQVQGTQAMNAEEVRLALSHLEGVPLALVSDGDVHRALEGFPRIGRYRIERIPPHTLVIQVQERTPVIALQREGSVEVFDAAGVLLDRVQEPPVGVPLGSTELSDVTTSAFRAAAVVVRDLPADLRDQAVTVTASSAQNVMFELGNGTQVIWGEPKDMQRKAAVLRALLAAVEAPQVVDVSAPDTPVFK